MRDRKSRLHDGRVEVAVCPDLRASTDRRRRSARRPAPRSGSPPPPPRAPAPGDGRAAASWTWSTTWSDASSAKASSAPRAMPMALATVAVHIQRQVEARIVEQALLRRQRADRQGMALGDEDIGDGEIVTARAAQAEHVPRIQDRGALPPAPRISASSARPPGVRIGLSPSQTTQGHMQPARVIDAAGKVPTTVDAIAAIDRARAAHAGGSSLRAAYRQGVRPCRGPPRHRASPWSSRRRWRSSCTSRWSRRRGRSPRSRERRRAAATRARPSSAAGTSAGGRPLPAPRP